jgi:malate dehydrogenase (oxaloacetate-decarboxylating)(NADP+)
MPRTRIHTTREEALAFHADRRPGKLEIRATKPLNSQRDLALAYSPGVAYPCLEIRDNPTKVYDYTAKSNTVAVVSNGTAVLGLGDLGALASKPVMEGKAVLFKRFADIDGIDIEVDETDVDAFCQAVRAIAPSFGGINLEDIKAPESFMIEQRLKELLDIPVMHDDQHGTAIIAAAGLINALQLTGRKLEDIQLVINGAGAAAIACVELVKAMGLPPEQAILCDSKGVIYKGREAGMNQWKSAHAVDTDKRTLAEALVGADVFFGLSIKDAVSQEMVQAMAANPLIFAMANPDPEITPEAVHAVRSDAIVATGRSDYPNQINNVLGFPYIFRGALDCRASGISERMKIAAAEAIAQLAQEEVPDEVGRAYGRNLKFGVDYIIPAPFDPRLLVAVPLAVARAAMEEGIARQPIADMEAYAESLRARLDPAFAAMQAIYARLRKTPKRFIFAEGEEPRAIRAAQVIQSAGLGQALLVGREQTIIDQMQEMAVEPEGLEICNAATTSAENQGYIQSLYKRLQREGLLERDARRLIQQDRHYYAAALLTADRGDVVISGLTRNFRACFSKYRRAVGLGSSTTAYGYTLHIDRGRAVFLADTAVQMQPSGKELASITRDLATQVRELGFEPRVAFVSYSNFGHGPDGDFQNLRDAMTILKAEGADFEFDGEMQANVALDYDLMRRTYPFCRLSGPATVLVMPSLNAANIAAKLIGSFSSGTLIGPIMRGFTKTVQIVTMDASVAQLVETAGIGALSSLDNAANP